MDVTSSYARKVRGEDTVNVQSKAIPTQSYSKPTKGAAVLATKARSRFQACLSVNLHGRQDGQGASAGSR